MDPNVTPSRATTEPPGWDCHVHVFDAAAPVLPGHYRPATRSLPEIEALARAHGVGHLVLVQPSVYGFDNGVLVEALQAGAGRHRGVAVVPADISDAALDALHAAGVRGIRFNRVSPVDTGQAPADVLARLAPRLRERGWHVQWYVRRQELAGLPALQASAGLPFVLDHLAGISADTPVDDPAWTALQALAAGGAWVKLSGWYRLGSVGLPYADLEAPLRRVAQLFGVRTVWGSDWPHTSLTSLDAAPALPYDATWAPVSRVVPPPLARSLRVSHPSALYDGLAAPAAFSVSLPASMSKDCP